MPVLSWTADEAFRRFEERTNLERGGTPHLRQYRLARMGEILHQLGDPHRKLPTVHIAGSKGKGSTAAYTAALLGAAGYRTGLYTSPHVNSYRERFTIYPAPGEPAAQKLGLEQEKIESALTAESRAVWGVVEAMAAAGVTDEELPTTFELLTALAFRFFLRCQCDWIVLETGLGGRLDATNLCTPTVTAITRIELEHQEYLGDTLSAIAGEKGGIIKEGIPVVIAPQHQEARDVLYRIAKERTAPVRDVTPPEEVPELKNLPLAMAGAVYRTNAAQALDILAILKDHKNITIPPTADLRRALATTTLPGRGERIGNVILDGAHTRESINHVGHNLPVTPLVIILGIVAGKDIVGMVTALSKVAAEIVVSRPGTFKPGNPEAVFAAVQAAGIPATLCLEPEVALKEARRRSRERFSDSRPLLVTGSFYMVAEIRALLLQETVCP